MARPGTIAGSWRRDQPPAQEAPHWPRHIRGLYAALPLYRLQRLPKAADESETRAINRLARAEARRIARATHHDRQQQQREAWRQIADAVARHRTDNGNHIEEIRKAQAGLRAEQKAGNRPGVMAWLRILRQLHGHQQG